MRTSPAAVAGRRTEDRSPLQSTLAAELSHQSWLQHCGEGVRSWGFSCHLVVGDRPALRAGHRYFSFTPRSLHTPTKHTELGIIPRLTESSAPRRNRLVWAYRAVGRSRKKGAEKAWPGRRGAETIEQTSIGQSAQAQVIGAHLYPCGVAGLCTSPAGAEVDQHSLWPHLRGCWLPPWP